MKLENRRNGEGDPVARLRPEDFWAKTTKGANGTEVPGISVRNHCLNVGCVAEALMAVLPPSVRALLPGENGQAAALLAALHDVGKITPGFQAKCQTWINKNSDWFQPNAGDVTNHALVSQRFIESLGNGRLSRLAEAIGAHHGRVQGDGILADGDSWEKRRADLTI